VDHQLGKVTGLALDKGIHFAYTAKHNGIVELRSLNFSKRAQFSVNDVEEHKTGDWADYMRGVTLALRDQFRLHNGVAGVFEGELPIGGLSSSAAVTLVYLDALCKVNDIRLSAQDMLLMAKKAENKYVGVSCGKLDQSCELLCRKEQLLYLDTKDDSYQLLPQAKCMPPWKVAIFFSGLERSLAGTKFNMRVDECRAAAYALQAFSNVEYGRLDETFLRNVPRELFDAHKERLPLNWRKRALHFYTEQERVEKGAQLWSKGDLQAFGQLMFQSGESSIVNYETGCPELKRLYEIMLETPGIYGGRFSGAGFKGCCCALVNPDYANDIEASVTEKYLASFPEMKGRFLVSFCDTSNGIFH
jgi:galactokinase/galacturonokinase